MPVFRMINKTGTERVSLDIPTDPEKVGVMANRNGFEPSLIDCPLSIEFANRLPSSGMSGREPMHEAGERSVDRR